MSLTLIMDSNLKLYHQNPTSEILKDGFPFSFGCSWRMSPPEFGSSWKTLLLVRISEILALRDLWEEAWGVKRGLWSPKIGVWVCIFRSTNQNG